MGSTSSYEDDARTRTRLFSRRRLLGAGIVGLALGGLIGAAGPGMERMRHWRGHGRHHRPLPFDDPDAMRAHAEDEVAWIADWLDAAPEQEARLQSIAADLVDRLAPFAERHRTTHDALRAAITAEPVDRAALERARTDALALASDATAVLAAALADALDVLTPEQRSKLAAHRGSHGWHRRG